MNLSSPVFVRRDRGTVSLVALCFVAVLGISLASYIAVCSRAMTLSNRSFQANVSQQLAELGLEEALRAFNKNDWSDWSNNGYAADWTLDTTNKRATATLTVPTSSFGQGTTATVKIRVDNYDAAHLGSTWSSSTTYRIGDLVGYNGTWCRSVQNANSNHTPDDLAWWVPALIPWTWSSNISYTSYDIVNYSGTWYRCHTSHTSSTSNQPPNTSYWTSVSSLSLSWSSSTSYARGAIVFASGAWYYSINSSNTNHAPPNSTYWAPMLDSAGAASYASSNTYNIGEAFVVGDYIFRSSTDTWYRCIASQPYTYSGGDYDDTSKWISSKPYIAWAYRSGVTYNYDDVVYYGSSSPAWYRCKVASTTSAPSIATDWENALSGTNTTSSPGPHGWSSSSINYNLWDTVYYSGQWYRCIKAHTSATSIYTPTNTTYWTNTPLFSTAWDSGKQYSQNDTVRYNGVWYLSLLNSNIAKNPTTDTTYWIGANTSNASYTWNTTTSYSAGAYRCYGGVWYKCLISHTNKSPNDTTYWTATWANSFSVTTGAPVVYAEASVSITNSPAVRTQLSAPIAPAPLFPNAAGATTNLTITTGGGTVDSYDSGTGAYGGSNITTSAVLAAGNVLTIGGATTVKGYLAWPSPPSGISNGTTLNGISFSTDKSRVSRSPYIPQTDIRVYNLGGTALPATSNWPSDTLTIGTPGAIAPGLYYHSGSLDLDDKTLNIAGPVVIDLRGGSFRIRNNGKIVVQNTGSLQMQLSQFRADSDADGIDNRTQDPRKVVFFPTGNFGSHHYRATDFPFYGIIHLPSANTSANTLIIGTGVEIYGALSAKNITFSSEATLHYDTSLRYATIPGAAQPWAVTEWRELPVTEQATMP